MAKDNQEKDMRGTVVNGALCEYSWVDESEWNLCTECGEELRKGEDGYTTTHGTCNDCYESMCLEGDDE